MAIDAGRIIDFLDSAQRPVRTAINAVLAILIGLLAAQLFWYVLAPSEAGASRVVSELPRPMMDTKSTLIVDRTVLFKKNFFETSESSVDVKLDAPETKLNLKLVGVTAPTTAHIVLSNNDVKRFQPGDTVTNGVELVSIASDRVVLSRDGNTEVLLLNAERSPGIVPFVEEQSELATIAESPTILTASGTPDQFFANVDVRPINRNGEEFLQLFATGPIAEFEKLQLKNGDILLEAGGVKGTDFEQLATLISGGETVVVTVERDGEPVQISIRFLP